jgi:LPXTG-motif cell wall-anchored protein
MYNDGPNVLGVVAPVVTTIGVAALPNTGSDMLVQLAAAVAAGLVTWGVLYVKGSYSA